MTHAIDECYDIKREGELALQHAANLLFEKIERSIDENSQVDRFIFEIYLTHCLLQAGWVKHIDPPEDQVNITLRISAAKSDAERELWGRAMRAQAYLKKL